MRDPPLCTVEDLDERYTLDRWADLQELMAVEAEYHRRYRAAAERERKKRKKKP